MYMSSVLELLRQYRVKAKKDGLENHLGDYNGQDCVDFKSVSNLVKCVFRIVRNVNLDRKA